MTEHDLPPLDDDLRALVDAAKSGIAPPSGADARVLARVEAIAFPPGGRGGAPGEGAGQESAAPAVPAKPFLRRLAPLVASFAIGGVVGGLAMRAATPPQLPINLQLPPPRIDAKGESAGVVSPVVVVPSLPPAETKADAPPVAPALDGGNPVAPSAAGPLRRPELGATASSMGEQSALAAERGLLDVGRGALERGDGKAALGATREHERRFPSGLLVQEREAMAIRALVLLGEMTEARARAARFSARFPGSVLLPTLESAVGAPPP